MTIYKKWELILVPFPFTDLSATKRRPALIVSPDTYNSGKDVVIMFVTSQINTAPRPGDYLLQNWRQAGLPKPSLSRMKFATIDKTVILKKLGEIEEIDKKKIAESLLIFFAS